MFEKDMEIIRDFVMLRLTLFVTFIGLFVLWMAFFGWIIWRLGPGGYGADDAQEDRERLCNAIQRLHPEDMLTCPEILESRD